MTSAPGTHRSNWQTEHKQSRFSRQTELGEECFPTLQGKVCSAYNLVQPFLYRSEYVGQATCEADPCDTRGATTKSTCSNSFFQQPAHPKGFSDRLLRLSSCTSTHLNVRVRAPVSKCSLFATSPACSVFSLPYIAFGMEGKGNSGFQRQKHF